MAEKNDGYDLWGLILTVVGVFLFIGYKRNPEVITEGWAVISVFCFCIGVALLRGERPRFSIVKIVKTIFKTILGRKSSEAPTIQAQPAQKKDDRNLLQEAAERLSDEQLRFLSDAYHKRMSKQQIVEQSERSLLPELQSNPNNKSIRSL